MLEGGQQSPEDGDVPDVRWSERSWEEEVVEWWVGSDGEGLRCGRLEGRAYDEVHGSYPFDCYLCAYRSPLIRFRSRDELASLFSSLTFLSYLPHLIFPTARRHPPRRRSFRLHPLHPTASSSESRRHFLLLPPSRLRSSQPLHLHLLPFCRSRPRSSPC